MNQEFIEALKLLEKERGVEMEMLIEAIEDALVAAYRREFEIHSRDRDKSKSHDAGSDEASEHAPENDGITAHIDRQTGEMRVYQPITIVEKVRNPHSELSLEQAHALSPDLEIGDQLVAVDRRISGDLRRKRQRASSIRGSRRLRKYAFMKNSAVCTDTQRHRAGRDPQ